VELRDARLVDADLGADLLHRDVAEVIEPDDLALARRQRLQGVADAVPRFGRLIGAIRRRRLRRHADVRQHHLERTVRRRQHRRRLDRADADDGAAETRFVGADAGRKIGQRRLGAGLAAEGLARGLELAALAADAARPGVLAQRVDHRPADAALGEGLELDPARVVVAVRGVDQADHAVLDEVSQVDGVRHRGGHPARDGLDEREARDDAVLRGHGFEVRVDHRRLQALTANEAPIAARPQVWFASLLSNPGTSTGVTPRATPVNLTQR